MNDRQNPIQGWMFFMGVMTLGACVFAGTSTLQDRHLSALTVALGFVSAAFFALGTWIHIKS